MPRLRPKKDANHDIIVVAISAAGGKVTDTSALGGGVVDIFAHYPCNNGHWVTLPYEIKTASGALTEEERRVSFDGAPGLAYIVRTPADAIALLRAHCAMLTCQCSCALPPLREASDAIAYFRRCGCLE